MVSELSSTRELMDGTASLLFGWNKGFQFFHSLLSFTSLKIESRSAARLVALEILILEGINNDMIVSTTKKKTKLSIANLTSLIIIPSETL